MMNKKGFSTVTTMVFLTLMGIFVIFFVFPDIFNPGADKIKEISKFQDTDEDGMTDYFEQVQGTCICDPNTVEKYFLIKEDLYKEPKPWSDDKVGYLIGYENKELVKEKILVEEPKTYLRLSEEEVDVIYDLFNDKKLEEPLVNHDFDYVVFASNARLEDLCLPSTTRACTYAKFVSDLLETNEGEPTGCKTPPAACTLMREEVASKDDKK